MRRTNLGCHVVAALALLSIANFAMAQLSITSSARSLQSAQDFNALGYPMSGPATFSNNDSTAASGVYSNSVASIANVSGTPWGLAVRRICLSITTEAVVRTRWSIPRLSREAARPPLTRA
jgi:hypothetical protein